MRAVRSTTETSELFRRADQLRSWELSRGWNARRDTEGHSGELAVEGGDDLADSLGGSGGGGDDVGGGATSSTPVLGGGACKSEFVTVVPGRLGEANAPSTVFWVAVVA